MSETRDGKKEMKVEDAFRAKAGINLMRSVSKTVSNVVIMVESGSTDNISPPVSWYRRAGLVAFAELARVTVPIKKVSILTVSLKVRESLARFGDAFKSSEKAVMVGLVKSFTNVVTN